MSFQIHALPYAPFAAFFDMDADTLASHAGTLQTVTSSSGSPSRVSLEDAEVGETVRLINYQHQPQASPYRAEHAIFVRKGAARAHVAPGTVPKVLSRRVISMRLFDENHMMIDAQVLDGKHLSEAIPVALAQQKTAYIHLHNAAPGCFAAKVTRAGPADLPG